MATNGEPTADARWRFESDLAGLREREANLREYEARLRSWQERLDAAGVVPRPSFSLPPFGGSASPLPGALDVDLRGAWEKLYRARALLEAEQKQVRDDRMVVRGIKSELERREAELAAREAAVRERELRPPAAAPVAVSRPVEESTLSAVRRLTEAPLQAARAVFKPSK